jgi:hypothetical protein
MRNLSSTILAMLVFASPLTGMALNERPLQPNEHPTNLPGVTTIEPPPAGFDPINASDHELAYHGFPPRPDQNTEPKAYATWVRAMNASASRIVPKLEPTSLSHAPAKENQKPASTAVENNVPIPAPHDNNLTIANMSGYVAQSGATSYGSTSFYYMVSDFVVPVAQQVGCSGAWAYASAWEGIDGFGSRDLLQAGVEFDAYCASAGLVRSTYYSAWYEWFPYGEVRIAGFPIAPNNEMFVEVWHTSPTQGYAYFLNYNTGQVVQVGFTAYPGYPLIGNSAEWIVEDAGPGIIGMVPFWNANAYTQLGVRYCSTSGTEVDSGVLPAAPHPILVAACAFVDVF